ncbi:MULTISPECIES: gas vesicle protein GvpL [Halobacterium]|uniref:gas vesicle protein GvpL n=1 Tax=Halobacterium TaxID=2239 RepID=UPI001964BC8A|nr:MULTISPECIES: gas vesicle protein GvpL [Halobacterium]MCF2164917.1 gas vesicle protein GvpL [Halobacterium salinarum]MCF2168989.1 gas vesicle protein GvpL [Halobacterium salinarum]MCF2237713.1 gas vesicle protein GvpL [Halobacterium salinarum]MDL0132821.1 gas vesicle protein GvpL [Halobacterium salinarum]QRY21661.1 gas vesicle protein GvpL [Halobacterium sp. GSL-19]
MTPAQSQARAQLPDGRYVYCVVDTTSVPSAPVGETTGIDDETVRVVSVDGVGAVVHDCTSVYDADDIDQVKRWLVTHQQVVDDVSDVFGTPLPMRFDTVFAGGDSALTDWLADTHPRLRTELDGFAGCWEYRVTLLWDPQPFEAHVTATDDTLQALEARQADADAGTTFLLEKQYDARLAERRRARRSALASDLSAAVEPVATQVASQDTTTSLRDESVSERHTPIARLAVLAPETDESALGSQLDDIAARDGVTIRFTGPWPPYTFAPDICTDEPNQA